MHATFLLLLGFVALSHWRQGQSLEATINGVGFVLALFACVLLHELGHALTAKKFGIRTRDITLLPIGGVARLERIPEDPMQELWVALGGPAVNLVIAAVLGAWLLVTATLEPLQSLSVTQGSFAQRLMVVNISLLIFNMLPAFPMDGGRVLRALLATRMDYTRATQTAANIGQGMALLFGFLGFFTNPFLIFIALFVWIGAAQEASMVQMKSALGGIPVSRAMLSDFKTLSSNDPLAHAIELILAGSQTDFPVVDNGRVVGVLTRNDLMRALAADGKESLVGDAMRRDCQFVHASEMLETALARLQDGGCQTLPVTRNGQLVGLITAENVGEFVMIQAAIGGDGRKPTLASGSRIGE
jgi:Zn-dependent protease/CBS domain-containing protein